MSKKKTTRIDAVYTSAPALATAMQELLNAGVLSSNMEVRSSMEISIPLPGVRPKSRVLLATILGGLLGGLGAFLVVRFVSWDYPLVTGGMPILSPMPTGIITYEFTALGAILATVAAVFFEARLRPDFNATGGSLDAEISDGNILLSVRSVDSDFPDGVREILSHAIRTACQCT